MKAKMRAAMLAVLAILIPALWAAVRAADKDGGSVPQRTYAQDKRDTLRGLQDVYVLVEGLTPEVERLGLTRDALQTDTELQLRQYGIGVRSNAKVDLWTSALLYVSVNVVGADGDTPSLLAVSMEVSCAQGVYLDRDPTTWCVAKTWWTGSLAKVSHAQLSQVRDMVKDKVAEFINDYLAVNPKEGKVKEESRTKGGTAESKP